MRNDEWKRRHSVSRHRLPVTRHPSLVTPMKSALVLFAHGARDPQWAEPFRVLQKAVSGKRPDLSVELAFLEIMEPALGDCVARLAAAGHRRITIAPLFLAQGGHLKQDLPRLVNDVRAKHAGIDLSLLPPIGEVAELLDAIAGWLVKKAPR
jgi:sirohydrochlorin cobaltochelatase